MGQSAADSSSRIHRPDGSVPEQVVSEQQASRDHGSEASGDDESPIDGSPHAYAQTVLEPPQPAQHLFSDKPGAAHPDREMVLGDFRIRQEIGRGGMGVVYEAEEISLRRIVALKVLPLAGLMDERQIRRFKNESMAAAQLNHPNIVPVHSVGCDRGVHYYAMQYINGENLASVITSLRKRIDVRATESGRKSSGRDSRRKSVPAAASKPDDSGLAETKEFVAPSESGIDSTSRDFVELMSSGTARKSSHSSRRAFKSLMRIGIEAAEALQHAHDSGIVHRDIKPSNLLIDGQSKVWVADFGLAQFRGHDGPSVTGDIIGTLRYMSPEQVLTRRVMVDNRTDIYSLGLTLYELVALRPAFEGNSAEEILRKVSFEEPAAIRKVNPRVPPDLETIINKAIAKNPDERYQSAQELADDLKCFQSDQPIRARRPSSVQRLQRWGNRHQLFVRSFLTGMVVLLFTSMAAAFVIWRAFQSEAGQRASAERLLTRSEGLRLIANSSLEVDRNPGRALLLAIEGARRQPGLEANRSLLAAMAANHERRALVGLNAPVGSAMFSPDGHLAVITATSESFGQGARPAIIFDVAAGKSVMTLDDGTAISSAAFSPDGRFVLTTSSPRPERVRDDLDDLRTTVPPAIWDVETGRKRTSFNDAFLLRAHRDAFSPDGTRVVTPGFGNTARVQSTVDGAQIVVLRGHERRVVFAAFSPDGNRVATISDDDTVRIWNANDGEQLVSLTPPPGDPSFVSAVGADSRMIAFGPDSRRLLIGWESGTQLIDVATGRPLNESRWRESMAGYSPRGDRIALWSNQGRRINVRDVDSHDLLCEIATTGTLNHVGWCPDGRSLVASTTDRVAVVYDSTSGGMISEFRGHQGQIRRSVFSPDGSLVITASDDRTARVWSVQSGDERDRYSAHTAPFAQSGVAVSSDGTQLIVATPPVVETHIRDLDGQPVPGTLGGLLTGSRYIGDQVLTVEDDHVIKWDINTSRQLAEATFPGHTISSASLSPDGRYAAVLIVNSPTVLWDTQTGDRQRLSDAPATSAVFSDDGSRLAMSLPDGRVELREMPSGDVAVKQEYDGGISSINFSRDGGLLATVTDRNVAHIMNARTGEPISDLVADDASFHEARFSHDGRRAVTTRWLLNNSVICWDVASGQPLAQHAAVGTVSIAMSPIDDRVAVASDRDGATIWDFEADETLRLTETPAAFARFTGPGDRVVTAPRTGRLFPPLFPSHRLVDGPQPMLQVWDAATGQVLAGKPLKDTPRAMSIHPDRGWIVLTTHVHGVSLFGVEGRELRRHVGAHARELTFMGYTPDHNRIVMASWDGTASVWEADGRLVHRFDGHVAPIVHAAISPNGELVATADGEGKCILWSPLTGQAQRELNGHTDQIRYVEFSSDGRQLLTVSRDKTVRVWDVATGASQVHRFEQGVVAAYFSPDGTRMLVMPAATARNGDDDVGRKDTHRLRLIHSATREFRDFPHEGRIMAFGFHPQEPRFLSVDTAGTLSLWDFENGAPQRTLSFPDQRVHYAEFSSDGTRIVTVDNRSISEWDAETLEQRLQIPTRSHFPVDAIWGVCRAGLMATTDDWIIAVTGDRRVQRWPRAPFDLAEMRAPRPLFDSEREQYWIRAEGEAQSR